LTPGLAPLRHCQVGLLGLGAENRSLARLLAGAGVMFSICDACEPDDRQMLSVQLGPWVREWRLGADYLSDLSRFDLLFRTPGMRPDLPELDAHRRQQKQVSSQTRLFAELCPAPLVGITGTKGKGTTASLLAAMLEHDGDRRIWLGGNIGKPPVDWLGEIRARDLAILELSSFQLCDWERSPGGAVLLNVTQDHLDYHGTVGDYIEAKQRICRFQNPDDWLVVDDDCPTASAMAEASPATVMRFSIRREVAVGAWVDGSGLMTRLAGDGSQRICAVDEIPLRGRHNLRNVAAAAAAARRLGAAPDVIAEAVRRFQGLPHRLQRVLGEGPVAFYNDSLATTPEAAMAALQAFTEPVVLIAGGSSKGADFSGLAQAIVSRSVRGVVLIGQEAASMAAALRAAGWPEARIDLEATSMAAAVASARRQALPGDVVLLAPACASFGMFADYRDRGEQFVSAARACC
jgi:UDP-N-acetylmuramoylalanine--D-glutamate ligase